MICIDLYSVTNIPACATRQIPLHYMLPISLCRILCIHLAHPNEMVCLSYGGSLKTLSLRVKQCLKSSVLYLKSDFTNVDPTTHSVSNHYTKFNRWCAIYLWPIPLSLWIDLKPPFLLRAVSTVIASHHGIHSHPRSSTYLQQASLTHLMTRILSFVP